MRRSLIADSVSDLVPEDLYLRLQGIGALRKVFLKIEGLNPAGSIKVKTARSLIAAAERTYGSLADRHLLESSSGNLGIALAGMCAAKGYRFTCVTDPNANPSAVAIMRALDANVVVVDRRDANGGFLTSRIAHIRRLTVGDPRYLWLNQYENPANPLAHERDTGREIVAAFPAVDYLFVGVGTGGTLMGCVRSLRRQSPRTRIVAVDAVGSVTFGDTPYPRRIPGLGASRPSELVDRTAPDEIVHVSEPDTVRECRWLARTAGLLVGGSTGTVLAAMREMSDRIEPDATVVAVSPDLGERYLDTVYSDGWVASHGLDVPA